MVIPNISNSDTGIDTRGILNQVIDTVNAQFVSFAITDPAINAAVATAVIDVYAGSVVTLTGAPTAQTLQSPTTVAAFKSFVVVNESTSTDNLVVTYGLGGDTVIIEPGHGQKFFWVGAEWSIGASLDAGEVSSLPTGWLAGTNVQANLNELLNGVGLTVTADTSISRSYSRIVSNATGPVTHTLPAILPNMVGIRYTLMNINSGPATWTTSTDTFVGIGPSVTIGKGSSIVVTPVEISTGVYGWML